MSFIETRLDDCVALGFQANPAYDTQITRLDNGKEQRNINRTRAQRSFSAAYNSFDDVEATLLLAAFHACRGSGYAFRFKDPTDYRVVMGSIGNTPGANQTPVQLVKLYTFGSETNTRTITKPVSGTVTVYQDDGAGNFVAKPGAIDTTTGLFTPTTNWTSGRALKASFEFDIAVRFANDDMPMTAENFRYTTLSAELLEVFL